ncbi:MAG: MFS transporter [Actinophytocola sp.]|uniref:MFS transporter n=1 Tax=Actinophytocola sp. TaxID=1872138 RepID=UPI0013239A63|nr:MFS transporter [Actinophytocola sp.]MPZ82225.1 MFS transporter [Actinophytocola sp.]
MRRPWPDHLGKVLAARLLLGGYFFVPYIVLYASSMGISLSLLLVIEALFALLIVAFDLPAGHLADRIGPRQALVLGAALQGGAALLLGTVPDAAAFWAAQPLFAAATALTMGADAALAAGVLRRAGRSGEFEAGERLFQSLNLAVTAVVLASASGLSLIGMRWTFVATTVAQGLAVVVLLRVADVRSESDVDRVPLGRRLRGLAQGVRRAPGLPVDLLAMILTGTAFSVLLYLTPVYYVRAGLTEHLVGVAAAGVALGASAAAFGLPDRWPLRVTVVLAVLAVLASAALGLESVAVVLIAAVVVQTAQARLVPRFRARVLDDLREHGEATAMSIVTTSRNLGFAVLTPFVGVLTAWSGPAGLAVLCAVLFAVAGLAMSARMSTRMSTSRQLETV